MHFCRINFRLLKAGPTFCILLSNAIDNKRNISSLKVTNNVTLISNKTKHRTFANLELNNHERKPLVILLSWLNAKKAHVLKYANFYLCQDYDVLCVDIKPWQILWPRRGCQVVARDILKFLDIHKSYSPLLLHGFSVGGYLWSEVMLQLAAQERRYEHILSRFVGQVWDSLADVTEVPEGFPHAVFPRSKMLQAALRQYIAYHLRIFDKVATCHYIRGSRMFYDSIIRAPALIFVSETDAIGSLKSNLKLREHWENIGIKVYWKCWKNSPHVGHFRYHREEYISELVAFLKNIGLNIKN